MKKSIILTILLAIMAFQAPIQAISLHGIWSTMTNLASQSVKTVCKSRILQCGLVGVTAIGSMAVAVAIKYVQRQQKKARETELDRAHQQASSAMDKATADLANKTIAQLRAILTELGQANSTLDSIDVSKYSNLVTNKQEIQRRLIEVIQIVQHNKKQRKAQLRVAEHVRPQITARLAAAQAQAEEAIQEVMGTENLAQAGLNRLNAQLQKAKQALKSIDVSLCPGQNDLQARK
jgi:hypothetical protein